jgi:hypothetical protein
MASIAEAIARHGGDDTYYTKAGQWLDAKPDSGSMLS